MEDNLLVRGQFLKKLYHNLLEEVEDRYQMRGMEIDVLLFLANNPDYDTAKDIVELRSLTKSHVSQAVDALMHKGYLTGVRDEKDRRCIHLVLEESAKPAVEEARRKQRECIQILLQGIPEEEKLVFQRVNQKIYENAKEALAAKGRKEIRPC